MQRLKAISGYIWAGLMVPLAIVTLMGLTPISKAIVDLTGVKISPWITGGEIRQTIPHGTYETRIHRPIFDALIGQRSEGFVQIVWAKKDALPAALTEQIDYDQDGQMDFEVTLHAQSKTAEYQSLSPYAITMEGPYDIGDGIGVRVTLKNK